MPKNNQSLTKNDLWEILGEFFDKVIARYLVEHVENRLDEHDRRFDKIDRTLERMEDRLDRHGKQLDNHEVRITKLVTSLA